MGLCLNFLVMEAISGSVEERKGVGEVPPMGELDGSSFVKPNNSKAKTQQVGRWKDNIRA